MLPAPLVREDAVDAVGEAGRRAETLDPEGGEIGRAVFTARCRAGEPGALPEVAGAVTTRCLGRGAGLGAPSARASSYASSWWGA